MKKRLLKQMGRRRHALAAATVALALGSIVLIRAQAAPHDQEPFHDQGQPSARHSTAFDGPLLTARVSLSQNAVAANGVREVLAELNLEAANVERAGPRAPVALAIALDTSGSMTGEKIDQAKQAVLALLRRMRPDDQIAIVTYNHMTTVLQRLAPVAEVRGEIEGRIRALYAAGGTIIPSALQAAANALDATGKFNDTPAIRVRRIVLISDGLDGSGESAQDIGARVRLYGGGRVSVSCLGIGTDYDERFLTSVADAGRGNYEFLARTAQLERFLRRELDEAAGTVVDGVVARIELPAGVRLVKAYGSESEGTTGSVRLAIGPMFGGDSRRVVLRLEATAEGPGDLGGLSVQVRYRTVSDLAQHIIAGEALALRAVPTEELALASLDPEVYATTRSVVLDDEQRRAVELWRSGDVRQAQQVSVQNSVTLRRLARRAPAAAPRLEAQAAEALDDSATFGATTAQSEAGRGYGLRSNTARRARTVRGRWVGH